MPKWHTFETLATYMSIYVLRHSMRTLTCQMSSCPRRQIQSDLTCTHGALTVESTLLVQESVKSAGWRVQRSWFAECLCDVPEFERLCDLVLSSLFIEQLVLGIAQITILVSMQVKVYTSNSVAAL